METISFIQSSLQQALKEVPEKIRDWFGSERITNLVIGLNREIGIEGEEIRVIPKLLLRLEVKDLEPQNFTQELSSQLKVEYEIAKSIAREIKKQILEPISPALHRTGVDINLIAIGGGLSLSEIKPKIPEETETIPPAKLPPGAPLQPIEIEAFKPAAPPIADTKTKLSDFEPVMPSDSIPTDKPFMIHQETETQSVAEKNKSMPTIGWFRKTTPAAGQEKSKAPEPPVKVQLETFGPKIEEKKESKEPIVAKTEIPKQKVVHYREVETPAPFGRPGIQPQPPKEVQPPKTEMPATKPFDTVQGRPFGATQTQQGKSFDTAQSGPSNAPQTQGKPFGFIQNKPEPPKPFGATQSKPFGINQQNKPSNITQDKPLDTIQSRPEPAKPEQPVKPTEPKVINLESFLGGPKENQPKDEIELEGNIINLKNNNKSGS